MVKKLEPSDRKEIVDLVNRLMDALAGGNKAAVVELTKHRLDDEAIAQGYSVDEVRNAAMNMVGSFSVVQKPPLPLLLEKAEFSPVAGGRVFYVSRGGFEPAIVFEDDKYRMSVDVYVGRIDRRWTIVR